MQYSECLATMSMQDRRWYDRSTLHTTPLTAVVLTTAFLPITRPRKNSHQQNDNRF